MKILINWNDMKCIIDGVSYSIPHKLYFNDYCGYDIKQYIIYYPDSTFYRKDDLILGYNGYNFYLLKLDENDKIIGRWMLHEIKN